VVWFRSWVLLSRRHTHFLPHPEVLYSSLVLDSTAGCGGGGVPGQGFIHKVVRKSQHEGALFGISGTTVSTFNVLIVVDRPFAIPNIGEFLYSIFTARG
jgi:hypothetical protein